MYLDFNRNCPDIEHPGEKHPLIGIEASGAGIKYCYSCGISEIIQVVGAGADKLLKISNELRKYEGKSLDELYEELAKSDDTNTQVKAVTKEDNIKKGESLFSEFKIDLRKVLCEDFGLCKKLPYLQVSIPQISAVAIADVLSTSSTGVSLSHIILVTSILMHIPLIQLKKWCNCP